MSDSTFSFQRRRNALEVLGCAWSGEPMTASDLIERTGLTRSTVIAVCDDLIELGWIEELANQRAAGDYIKGRPARRYALRREAGVVVGVDAGQHSVGVFVADLLGDPLARHVEPVDHEHVEDVPPERRLADIERILDRTLAQAGVADSEVLAITFGVPAPVDARGRSPEGDNDFWTVMNPGLSDRFAARGWAAVIDNDANLAALAEGWRGAAVDSDDYLTLLSGERLGGGVVLGGRLLRGSRGLTGEMRYLDLVEGVGSAEGIAALARLWAREALAAPRRSASLLDRTENPGAEQVFAAAEAGDPLAAAIVDRLAERLTAVAATLANLLDVSLIVVGGALAASVEPLLAEVARRLVGRVHAPAPRILASTLGDQAVALGAVRSGLDRVRADPLALRLSGHAVDGVAAGV
ncbi:Sugar kinase of the NBD/HSP70 family, may contain an N-terminal HTH domain [Rathayibacter oskolensis]|uniref:Sugar kinase of the NBD/HSP70 family, may contain an N-terminal HTH domain n=1 Tax=Rathayibacter oskolensis TaxID=1891671 RepID=A0A1X7P6H0_9MICO|nr:ROK family transcriptional regulator [Rathayibacter oskolensis]SMH46523.1 Sugar kinase of the NBD/HSP70 family, may contain an N-terminal HTH domain [Rathayibacter oskolensis]